MAKEIAFNHTFLGNVDNRGKPLSVRSPNTKLTAYNGTAVHCYGSIRIPCKDKRGQWFDLEFYIVDTPEPAVIGLPGSRTLGLVTLHCAIQNTNAAPEDNDSELKLSPYIQPSSFETH